MSLYRWKVRSQPIRRTKKTSGFRASGSSGCCSAWQRLHYWRSWLIIVIPVGWLFYLSFIGSDGQLSLENYQRMIQYKSYARVFVTTFQVSILTTVLCILIGYPLAYFLAILPQRMAGFFMLAVLLPFLDFAAGAHLCLAGSAAEKWNSE